MKYIEGTPRNQLCLFEEKLDDMIEEENLIHPSIFESLIDYTIY